MSQLGCPGCEWKPNLFGRSALANCLLLLSRQSSQEIKIRAWCQWWLRLSHERGELFIGVSFRKQSAFVSPSSLVSPFFPKNCTENVRGVILDIKLKNKEIPTNSVKDKKTFYQRLANCLFLLFETKLAQKRGKWYPPKRHFQEIKNHKINGLLNFLSLKRERKENSHTLSLLDRNLKGLKVLGVQTSLE